MLTAAQTLVVANTATDSDGPAQTLTWSSLIAPTNAALDSASNLIFLRVTDKGRPSLAATQSFSLFVLRPSAPTLGSPTMSDGGFAMAVAGDAGPDYTILASTNLVQWTPFLTTNPAVLPFWVTDAAARTNGHRFYRVQLGP